MNKIYKYLRLIIYLTPVYILAILICRDLVIGGLVSFTYNLRWDNPVVSRYYPEDRLGDVRQIDNRYYQDILKEPVYFETRLMQKFEQATVTLVYKNSKNQKILVGPETFGQDDWNFQLQTIKNILPPDSWQTAVITYKLDKVKINNRKLRWLISLPDYPPDSGNIQLSSLSIAFSKKPLKFSELPGLMLNYFKKYF
jgi:hypothetical protein